MIRSKPLSLKRLLLAATILSAPVVAIAPVPAAAQIEISVPIPPPMLPVYEQPPMPDLGYIWTPGYWNWSQPVGFYWVPGTWILPPSANVLWTPPYWDWSGGYYRFHDGYWGAHVGYYGGINYGYGYGGQGYLGGRWQGTGFVYNRAVNNFGPMHVSNAYSGSVRVANKSHISYAGGSGGVNSAPSLGDRQAGQDHHVPMTAEQTSHISAAARQPDLAASHNGGRPAIGATARPAQFEGPGVIHVAPGGVGLHALVPPSPSAAFAPGRPGGHADEPSEYHGSTAPPHLRPTLNGAQSTAAPWPQRPGAPEPPRPAEHVTASPTDRGGVPPVDRPPAAPMQRETARPDQRGAPPDVAPSDQHIAIPEMNRPIERPAAHPVQRDAARPVEQRAAPPAERPSEPIIAHAAPPTAHGEKEKER